MIRDVPGSLNISDDIVVFGTDIKSHDKALDQALHRLQDAGLTTNLETCEFRKPSIEFFGMIFSEDGVSPDPKKVEDLKKSPEPKNVSEVRSFLGKSSHQKGDRVGMGENPNECLSGSEGSTGGMCYGSVIQGC